MIVLDKKSAKITINRYKMIDCTKLILVHNLTNQAFEFNELINSSISDFFYEFTIDMSVLLDGEYTVHLYDEDGKEICTPLLAVCGEYKKARTSYQKQNNRIVYERN